MEVTLEITKWVTLETVPLLCDTFTVADINVRKNLTHSHLEFQNFLRTKPTPAHVFLPDQRDKWCLQPFACLLHRGCVPPIALALTSPWLPSQAPRHHIYLSLFHGIGVCGFRMCSSLRWAPSLYRYQCCCNLAIKTSSVYWCTRSLISITKYFLEVAREFWPNFSYKWLI